MNNQNLCQKPYIFINFKGLKGQQAIRLVNDLNKVEDSVKNEYQICIILYMQDALAITGDNSFPVFVSDWDNFIGITYEEVISSKIEGVVLNHPQCPMAVEQLEECYEKAKNHKLKVAMGAGGLNEARELFYKFSPDLMFVEHKEFIGGDSSIVDSCAELIQQTISEIKTNLLFGGGIKGFDDIEFIIRSGGKGVLVSSIILKSQQPLKALQTLIQPVHSSIL